MKTALALRELEPKATELFPGAPLIDHALVVAETTLAPAGKPVRALTLNGTVPGPVLRFRVGDIARIRVTNTLPREETSVHWHGLLVPNLEDGVPYLTTPPIKPGQSRTFEFLLKHPGTYWYHSHTGLHEQRGIYGAIVVEPAANTHPRTDLPRIDRDEVLVLSDWTNENPHEVMRTLLRGSGWYALRKGTAQSLLGAHRSGHLADFLMRERARLPAMDVSDIAYDAFLINGQRTSRLAGRPGETIRLRIINAAASTYFYLTSSTGPLTLVAADGPDIRPIRQNRLLIGMAETYDVLLTIPPSGTAGLRATAQDNSGHASAWIGDASPTGTAGHPAGLRPLPAPDLYNMDAALEAILDEHDADGAISDADALAAESPRPLPPYTRLQSTQPTTLPADAPVRDLTLKLTGDMLRYTWSLDDQTMSPDNAIRVRRGEILRLTLVNNTMMHHPMHLHGHFFRLLMPGAADPAYSPLKHTVDVPPMTRRVIEFHADENRDWLFHCHLLYHHKTGMARVFSYDDQGPAHVPDLGEHARAHTYAWIDGTAQSHMSDGLATVQSGRHNLNLGWELGWERVPRRDYEIDATYSRYFNPRWTAFAGYRLTNLPGGAASVIAGATYLLPYNVDATLTFQSDGNARFGLGKDIPLTARLGLVLRADYDTAQDFGWSLSTTYTLTKQFSLIATCDDDYGPGAGVAFRF
jgi:FtsP/CotA-like multicopper oxidase with cupredoxin domain